MSIFLVLFLTAVGNVTNLVKYLSQKFERCHFKECFGTFLAVIVIATGITRESSECSSGVSLLSNARA